MITPNLANFITVGIMAILFFALVKFGKGLIFGGNVSDD